MILNIFSIGFLYFKRNPYIRRLYPKPGKVQIPYHIFGVMFDYSEGKNVPIGVPIGLSQYKFRNATSDRQDEHFLDVFEPKLIYRKPTKEDLLEKQ